MSYIALLGGLRISGSDSEGEVRVIELPGHPFYVGTLFVPQTRSTKRHPHPLVTAFVQAVAARGGPQDSGRSIKVTRERKPLQGLAMNLDDLHRRKCEIRVWVISLAIASAFQ